jgi:hypothetical protein
MQQIENLLADSINDNGKWLKSSRRKTIILFSDLSHHRTYRSVYGGSSEFNASFDMFVLD